MKELTIILKLKCTIWGIPAHLNEIRGTLSNKLREI